MLELSKGMDEAGIRIPPVEVSVRGPYLRLGVSSDYLRALRIRSHITISLQPSGYISGFTVSFFTPTHHGQSSRAFGCPNEAASFEAERPRYVQLTGLWRHHAV